MCNSACRGCGCPLQSIVHPAWFQNSPLIRSKLCRRISASLAVNGHMLIAEFNAWVRESEIAKGVHQHQPRSLWAVRWFHRVRQASDNLRLPSLRHEVFQRERAG